MCAVTVGHEVGAPVAALRVGFSLATLAPGYVGGAESFARGVLDGLRRHDVSELRVRVIANHTAASAYASRAGGNVDLVTVPGPFKSGRLARAVAMARMRVDAGRLAARTARELDVIHYPMTVPLPARRRPSHSAHVAGHATS